jgi:hypothetical protein
MPFADGKVGLAEMFINRDLREGRLHAVSMALDGTLRLLDGSYWQQRNVRAPLIPEEGVRVDPSEEGRYFILRAGLDEWYPANPATPATPADRQLCAEGRSVARAEKMEPATGIAEVSQSVPEARIEAAEASPPDHTEPAEQLERPAVLRNPDDEPGKTVPRHAGGRPSEINWASAKAYVESVIARYRRRYRQPLPRKKEGAPNRAGIVRVMGRFFRSNEPKPWPTPPHIYRWLREHPEEWQGWFD